MKQNLINEIENYAAYDPAEERDRQAMLALLRGTDDCFMRSDFPAHTIGGALLLSPDGKKTLLTHHKSLNKWLHLSGHADGEIDLRNVALREAKEESGIEEIDIISPAIFDLDVHVVAANPHRREPAHFHHELRYLMRARQTNFIISDESHDLNWFTAEETAQLDMPDFARRLIRKWQDWQKVL